MILDKELLPRIWESTSFMFKKIISMIEVAYLVSDADAHINTLSTLARSSTVLPHIAKLA